MARWPFRPTPSPGALRSDEEADIREELELYLELRTEELIAEGMEPAEARREAEARFGNPEVWRRRLRRQAARHGGSGAAMRLGHVRQDLAYALRTFRRNPGFTAMATLTLAVALAGNTAIFSVLDSTVLQALPFPDHERLVFVNGYHLQNGERAIRLASVPEFRDWRERSRTVDPIAAVVSTSVTVTGDGEAERAAVEIVSEDYLELVGGRAELGRTFAPEEYAAPDGFPVVILSHGLWQRRFGGDPDIVGRTLQVNDRTVSVVGVMPDAFAGVSLGADLWAPLGMISLAGSVEILEARGSRFLPVIGRLAPGVDRDQAQDELDGIARDLQELYPRAHEDRFAQIQPFREGFLGTTERLLWVLFGGAALLLLIASANVANLLLVRANARTRELVVRRAVGADGGRVARQLLTESLALSALGGAAGLVLAMWGLSAMAPLIPTGVLPAYADLSVSPRAFGFTLVTLVVVGVAAGLAPALSSARRDLAASLRSGERGMMGRRARAQQVFVVTQVGLALLLLVGAGLLTRSFRAQLAVDPGLELEDIQVFRVQPPRERYPDAASLRVFTDEIVRRISEVPGVTAAAASSDFPFRGGSSGAYIFRADDPETRIRFHHHSVTPGFFENLGVELRTGRLLAPSDDENTAGVAVVTEALVRRVFPEETSAVGRTLYVGDPSDPDNAAEIIGVVENVRFRNLTQDMMDGPNSPDVFFSIRQIPARTLEISYRADGDISAAVIREAVRELDASIPVYALSSLRELYRTQTATPRFAAFLMGLFSALALSLACVGIYGVLAFAVGQRDQEMAVRRALGARAGDVARSVVLDGVRLAAVGLLIGGGAALLGGRVLGSLLFDVEATDPVTFGVVATGMMGVAVVAAAIPAWRACRKAPADALAAD
jgi:predicted permease